MKLVLTALKCDLRKDEFENANPNAITYEQGLAKAKEIGAVKYLGMICCLSACATVALALTDSQNAPRSRTAA